MILGYNEHMQKIRLPLIVGIVTFLALFIISSIGFAEKTPNHFLKVSFLDVGQGDAIFIESPTGTQVLIDGGKTSVVLHELESVMGFFDRTIDMVVATHPDMDHIGGLIDVLERYEVATILLTENMSDTPAFKIFQDRVRDEDAKIIYARRGQVFDLGSGDMGSTTLSILFPDHDPREMESNLSSIVARLVYGESEYMLTGDSPQEIEEYLVSIGPDLLVSDVLKAGHHGSRTSSSEIFVEVVNPTYAIISAGKDNSYGHPHREVTEIFSRHDVAVMSTAESHAIHTISDGTSIQFK